jgi:hypothetical protein
LPSRFYTVGTRASLKSPETSTLNGSWSKRPHGRPWLQSQLEKFYFNVQLPGIAAPSPTGGIVRNKNAFRNETISKQWPTTAAKFVVDATGRQVLISTPQLHTHDVPPHHSAHINPFTHQRLPAHSIVQPCPSRVTGGDWTCFPRFLIGFMAFSLNIYLKSTIETFGPVLATAATPSCGFACTSWARGCCYQATPHPQSQKVKRNSYRYCSRHITGGPR